MLDKQRGVIEYDESLEAVLNVGRILASFKICELRWGRH
jgi:hypothetical protein